MLWVDVLFDQDSIFLIGSMSIVYGLSKRGGGSSNVHVVLKGGGVIKMFMSIHSKGRGV